MRSALLTTGRLALVAWVAMCVVAACADDSATAPKKKDEGTCTHVPIDGKGPVVVTPGPCR